MDFSVITWPVVFNLFLLLLIGIGPKIALVPFLEKTKSFDAEKQREIGTKMVKTAIFTALILFATGALLMRLLHVSAGAISVGGGIVLLILALRMTFGAGESNTEMTDTAVDHHQLAVYPLAIPYLLNPVGMAVLLVASSRVESVLSVVMVVGLILLIGAFDLLVFRNMDKLAKRLNPTSLVISEVVFGVLLTALSVELAVNGLNLLGIIETAPHH